MTTLQSTRRIFWKRVSDRESKRAKRGWKKRHTQLAEREVDADTLRWMALQDRKGKGAATMEICSPGKDSYLEIRHAKRRHDAYDIYLGGRLVCSGGRIAVGKYLGASLP